MSNASGDPVKEGHEANWTTTAIPDVCRKICDSSVFNRAGLQNLPPASQMLLQGNLSELKGKLWRMGRQRTSLTGKSQKNMIMTLTFPSPHNFMFCPFLKTFHHYLLSKKKASPRQLWKKKQEHSLFPPPSCTYATNGQIIWRDFLTIS